jgi:MFS family permease
LRGHFAVGIEGFWTIGTIVQAGLAYGLLDQYGWRPLVAVSTAPYAVLLLLLPFVPESPRFLLVKVGSGSWCPPLCLCRGVGVGWGGVGGE